MEHNGRLYLTSDAAVLSDSQYRYIIAPLEITHGTKKGKSATLLTNLDAFCRALQFPHTALVEIAKKRLARHFSCRVGVDAATGHLILGGHYPVADVKRVLYEFIQQTLLCQMCDKPEVQLRAKKNGLIRQTCRACGVKAFLTELDPTIAKSLIASDAVVMLPAPAVTTPVV